MSNYSVLRYPGGKTKAIKYLDKYLPNEVNEICSPFFGGGSFELYLSSKGIKVHAYDNFYPLVCFWQSLKENKELLIEYVESMYPLSKDRFYELQKSIFEVNDKVMIGAIFYVLNRSSFSGTGLSGGMSPNHPRFTLSQIEKLKGFDMGIKVEQLSFEDSILKHDCLVYADPPYLIDQSLYGNKGDMHKSFNHNLLAEILNDRGNFILSYNDCDEIRYLYRDHFFYYPEWCYGMNKTKKSNEILIISKDNKK